MGFASLYPSYGPEFCSHFVLDKIPIIAILPPVLFGEGRSHETSLNGARCGACGPGEDVSPSTRVVGGRRPGPIRGSAASARLDVVRAKAGKPAGWLSPGFASEPKGKAPSTRKNGPSIRKNVAVARRKALRGCGVAGDPARRAASVTPAPCGAPPPLMVRGEICSNLGRASAARKWMLVHSADETKPSSAAECASATPPRMTC
jgi:hypothetical protein